MMAIDNLQRMVPPLLDWFSVHARELPWRSDPLPYYVWVSEIMLQQTRVEAVRPYFARFMEELPDLASLAACPDEKLMKLWEGLGYYSRARHLKQAAQKIMEDYGGSLPADYDALKSLPGIGSYTAGAVASIAWHLPVSAVDGNVLRVMSRLTGSEEEIDDPGVKRFWKEKLDELLVKSGADSSAFNQALMDLGAMVCLPRGSSDCPACPLRELCRAYQDGSTDRIPVRRKKQARRIEKRTVLVVRDPFSTLICKRADRGLLAGLWELPNVEGWLDEGQLLEACSEMGLAPVRILPLPEAKHVFSHLEWHMKGYLVLVEDMLDYSRGPEERERISAAGKKDRGDPPAPAKDRKKGRKENAFPAGPSLQDKYLVVEPVRAQENYSLPSAFRSYLSYLDIRTGRSREDLQSLSAPKPADAESEVDRSSAQT